MNNDTTLDYQKLLTDALLKQMIILGPQITLIKAHNVAGLTVNSDGRVTDISGDPKAISIKLLEEFRELSPLMVKKTMQPLLSTILATYPQSQTSQKVDELAEEAQVSEEKPTEETQESADMAKAEPEQHEEAKIVT